MAGVDVEGLTSVSTSGSVDVTGAAYDFAVASHGTSVAFGNVRPNATRNLSVSNVLLGSVAVRFPQTTLQWNAAKLTFDNEKAANAYLRRTYRKGFEVAGL